MKCTHIALQVRDIERSIGFYARYCGMQIIHDRTDDFRVVWLGWGERPARFAIVLLDQDYPQNTPAPFSHIGIAVASEAEVDRIAAQATADGVAVSWPPRDAGPYAGYFCGFCDPDGNVVEFSHGQPLG